MTEASTDAVQPPKQLDGVVEDDKGNVVIAAPAALAIVEIPQEED